MYGQTAPAVPALRLVVCDPALDVITFAADSKNDPARTNVVALDIATGNTLCDCRGAICGKVCWHCQAVADAWQQHPAVRALRWLTDVQLLRCGRKAAGMVAAYGAHVRADDALTLLAARTEYRRRHARRGVAPALAA